MSDEKHVTAAPVWLMQIGFDYFTGKELGEDPSKSPHMPVRAARLDQGTVLATAWDKVLVKHADETCQVFGHKSGPITVKCKNVEDAVFLESGLCFIENGQIKIQSFEKCDVSQMDSVYKWSKISMIESEQRVYAVTDKGQLYKVSDKINSIPKWIPLIVSVTHISCGISHGIALSDNGTLYTWGNGSRGQLGHGTTDDQQKPKLVDLLCGVKITTIAAGGWHSMALADTGDIYVWGWNESGQLGFPTKSIKEVYDDSKIGMLISPKLLELEKYTESDGFLSICSISCGSRHSVAVTNEGNAISWGWGKYGQLGQKCCVSTNTDGSAETGSKKLKINNNSRHLYKCNVKEHLPGMVDYFCHGRYRALSVHCGRWLTYFSYTNTDS